MRLNWFLPFRKPPTKKDGSAPRAGGARTGLSILGPTWLASPARRTVQTISFLLFLALFFYVSWPYGSPDYVQTLRGKEIIPAETFLALDPLVSISTALAARMWVWSLVWAAVLLGVCIAIPRGFCGYVCPLGTLIDLCDWAVWKRVEKGGAAGRGWWVHLKYYVLLATLVASACGVLVSGFVSAIPVVTRGLCFLLAPLQIGFLKGWYLIPPMNAGHLVSVVLFAAVFGLGFFAPRFWCRHVCPTGAVFSVANLLRLNERKVEATCIQCGRCVEVCSFDAIRPDYTTRAADCTFCQTCGGVCPVEATAFSGRFSGPRSSSPAALSDSAALSDVSLTRRGFVAGAVGGLFVGGGIHRLFGADARSAASVVPVRPPGSVPEPQFLQLCIRCGACFQICPNNVLQPVSFEQGIEGIWTPQVVAQWSGCEPKCNNCGQVCPTGAIRALPIEEKRAARIGLAIVNEKTCLPFAGSEACQMCYDECKSAGYDAIEFRRVGVQMDDNGRPLEDSGFLAPVILVEKCIGCGLCETRCYRINVAQKRLLPETAIHIVAGPGKEDRLTRGSYLALRQEELRKKKEQQPPQTQQPSAPGNDYLPDFLK